MQWFIETIQKYSISKMNIFIFEILFLLFYLCNCLNYGFQNKSEYIAKLSEQVRRSYSSSKFCILHRGKICFFLTSERFGSSLVEALCNIKCAFLLVGKKFTGKDICRHEQYPNTIRGEPVWILDTVMYVRIRKKELSKSVIRTWKLMSARINYKCL